MVVGDRKAVGFLLNLPDEGKHRLTAHNADFPAVRRHQGACAVAVVLHHAEDRDRYAELLRNGQGRLCVSLAAVDEEHVRKRQKPLVPIRRPLEPPAQDLPHGGVIVRPSVQLLDSEPPVSAFQRPGSAVDHHGGHNVAAAGVGDVVGLQPFRGRGKVQHFSQQSHGMGGAFLGGGSPFRFLGGVPLGQAAEFLLFSPLRHVDPDLVARPLRQHLGKLRAVVLRFEGQKDFVGQDGAGKIILGRQCREHFRLFLFYGGGK